MRAHSDDDVTVCFVVCTGRLVALALVEVVQWFKETEVFDNTGSAVGWQAQESNWPSSGVGRIMIDPIIISAARAILRRHVTRCYPGLYH